MTLSELSKQYEISAHLIAERMQELRLQERQTDDEAQRIALHHRFLMLRPMLRDCRSIYYLTKHYYDRSFSRDERYTL